MPVSIPLLAQFMDKVQFMSGGDMLGEVSSPVGLDWCIAEVPEVTAGCMTACALAKPCVLSVGAGDFDRAGLIEGCVNIQRDLTLSIAPLTGIA